MQVRGKSKNKVNTKSTGYRVPEESRLAEERYGNLSALNEMLMQSSNLAQTLFTHQLQHGLYLINSSQLTTETLNRAKEITLLAAKQYRQMNVPNANKGKEPANYSVQECPEGSEMIDKGQIIQERQKLSEGIDQNQQPNPSKSTQIQHLNTSTKHPTQMELQN